MDPNSIDWSNPASQISDHFTVKEATYLPSWGVYHSPSDQEKANILIAADMMEKIREYLGEKPINVNCWIRPLSVNCDSPRYMGRNYNQFVGGAQNSAHLVGLAVDFTVSTMTCNDVRYLLESQLEEFQMRMERKPDSSWVHADMRQPLPGHSRYFVP